LRKAQQFGEAASILLEFADEAEELADAYVTLCVHAGIAAADVICIRRLGRYANGQNHSEAVRLLESTDRGSAKHLQTLLGMKTKAGYSYLSPSKAERARAERAMNALLETAR
jgi:hypothetical protein